MSRLFAPLMALLLLASLVAPASVAPVGTAQAATECDWVDDVIWSLGFGLGSPECAPSKLSAEAQAIEDSENNQTHLDLYNGLVAQDDMKETSLNLQHSYLNDTRTTAFIKAENATINAIEAGDSRSSVNTSARSAVGDYYTAAQQERAIETWNNQVLAVKYAFNRSKQENISTSNEITGDHPELSVRYENLQANENLQSFTIDEFVKTSVTLINGTTAQAWAINYTATGEESGTTTTDSGQIGFASPDTLEETSTTSSLRFNGFYADPPSGSTLSQENALYTKDYGTLNNDMKDASTQIKDNAEKYASKLYDAEQSGSLNASDYASPYVMAQEWSTSWNETGYWSYAVSSLSAMGLETPDLNNTGVMNVRYNGVVYEGLIMSDAAPNGSWETNKTYNASTIEGRQWLVTTAGERLVIEGEFTISEMTNQQGEQINSTKTIKYVYQGSNESEYEDLQTKILDLQQEIEERAPAGGGASSDGKIFGLSKAEAAGAVVVIVGGGLLLGGGGGGAAGAAGGAFGGSGGSNMARRRRR